MAQATGPENIGPERTLPGRLARTPVLSPSRITLENNGKIRQQPDRANAFAGASGGPKPPKTSSPVNDARGTNSMKSEETGSKRQIQNTMRIMQKGQTEALSTSSEVPMTAPLPPFSH